MHPVRSQQCEANYSLQAQKTVVVGFGFQMLVQRNYSTRIQRKYEWKCDADCLNHINYILACQHNLSFWIAQIFFKTWDGRKFPEFYLHVVKEVIRAMESPLAVLDLVRLAEELRGKNILKTTHTNKHRHRHTQTGKAVWTQTRAHTHKLLK